MKLKFTAKQELIIYGLGRFSPGQEVEVKKSEAGKYLGTGLFKEVEKESGKVPKKEKKEKVIE